MLVISFNSYKGGACRTTTCYNTLPYLAEKLGATSKQPILVFDVDLDSMGLTSLFLGEQKQSVAKEYSARHLFVNDENGINTKISSRGISSIEKGEWLFKHFTKVGNHLGLEDDGSVLFLGADTKNDVISDDEFKSMEEDSPLEVLLDALREMNLQPKAVVFDCASGVQLTTLRVIMSIDRSVMCMRPTTQFRIGTRDYVLNKIPDKLGIVSYAKREIILLPTAVPSIMIPDDESDRKAVEDELKQLKAKVYKKINRDIVETVKADRRAKQYYELNAKMADFENDVVGIPEIQRFKWSESELIHNLKNTLSAEEKLLESRYIMLAEMLVEDME